MSTGFYMRMKGSCAERVFDPLNAAHPLLEITCMACNSQFEEGDRTSLVPLGPGGDFDAQTKALAGAYYNAVCIPVHAGCAGLREEMPPPVPDITDPERSL